MKGLNKKPRQKSDTPFLCFNDQITIKNERQQTLFTKGFIDKNLYLSQLKEAQNLFVIESKHKASLDTEPSYDNKVAVCFGSQILIKHVISSKYLCVITQQGTSWLFMEKNRDQNCFFVLLPLRSFQKEAIQSHNILNLSLKMLLATITQIRLINSKVEDVVKREMKKKIHSTYYSLDIDFNINIKRQASQPALVSEVYQSKLNQKIKEKVLLYKAKFQPVFQQIRQQINHFIINYLSARSLSETQAKIKKCIIELRQHVTQFLRQDCAFRSQKQIKLQKQGRICSEYLCRLNHINAKIQPIIQSIKRLTSQLNVTQTATIFLSFAEETLVKKNKEETFIVTANSFFQNIDRLISHTNQEFKQHFNQDELNPFYQQFQTFICQVKQILSQEQSEILPGKQSQNLLKMTSNYDESSKRNYQQQVHEKIIEKIKKLTIFYQEYYKIQKRLNRRINLLKQKFVEKLSNLFQSQKENMQQSQNNRVVILFDDFYNKAKNIPKQIQSEKDKIIRLKAELSSFNLDKDSLIIFSALKIFIKRCREILTKNKSKEDAYFLSKIINIQSAQVSQSFTILDNSFDNLEFLIQQLQQKYSQLNDYQANWTVKTQSFLIQLDKICENSLQKIDSYSYIQSLPDSDKDILEALSFPKKMVLQIKDKIYQQFSQIKDNAKIIRSVKGLKMQDLEWNEQFSAILSFNLITRNLLEDLDQIKRRNQLMEDQVCMLNPVLYAEVDKLVNQIRPQIEQQRDSSIKCWQVDNQNQIQFNQNSNSMVQQVIKMLQTFKSSLNQVKEGYVGSNELITNQSSFKFTKSFALSQKKKLSQNILQFLVQSLDQKLKSSKNQLHTIQKVSQVFPHYEKIQLYAQQILRKIPYFLQEKCFVPSNIKNCFQNSKILQNNEALSICSVGLYKNNSVWQFNHKIQTNDSYGFEKGYICLVSSQDQCDLCVNFIDEGRAQIEYLPAKQKFHFNSLFAIEIDTDKKMYLKHLLTGSYFPFSQNKSIKKVLTLEPLLKFNRRSRKTPPFNIYFDGILYKRNTQISEMHGFWIQKVQRKHIQQVMSIQGIDCQIWIPFMIEYLKQQKTFKRQMLLKQCGVIQYLIVLFRILPIGNLIKQAATLLFLICENNSANKKRCCKYIFQLFNQPHRVSILAIFSEIFVDQEDSKWMKQIITETILEKIIFQFTIYDTHSKQYIRIFRSLCGSTTNPFKRSQNTFFHLFFADKNEKLFEYEYDPQKHILKTKISKKLRYQLTCQNKCIKISNGQQSKPYNSLSIEKKKYIRQYFYLIADCIRWNNQNIQIFRKSYTLFSLVEILQSGDEQLYGPVLSLIVSAYLQPERRYYLYIFHPGYSRLFQNGKLLQKAKGVEANILTNFIINSFKKLVINPKTTTSRILLRAFQLTLKNGYWKSLQTAKRIMFSHDIKYQSDSCSNLHQTYKDKLAYKNLVANRIRTLKVRSLLLNMGINSLLSRINNESQSAVQKQIQQFSLMPQWEIQKCIIQCCSSSQAKLKNSALNSFYEQYNIPMIIKNRLRQVQEQQKSNNLTLQIDQIFSNYKFPLKTPQQHFKIIASCIDFVKFDEITQNGLRKRAFSSLENVYRYQKSNPQMQNIAFKIGVYKSLIRQIQRYISFQKKFKVRQAKNYIYWKILTLYAIMKNNISIRKQIARIRHIFLKLLLQGQYTMIYYISADILEQIYRSDHKMIIKNDNQDLSLICNATQQILFRSGFLGIKECKLVALLSVYLESGHKKMHPNFDKIFTSICKREQLKFLMDMCYEASLRFSEKDAKNEKMKDQLVGQQHLYDLFCILIYNFMSGIGSLYLTKLSTINQILLASNGAGPQGYMFKMFERPHLKKTNHMLKVIKNYNWNLKAKVFKSILIDQKSSNIQIRRLISLFLQDLKYKCARLRKPYKNDREIGVFISHLSDILPSIKKALTFGRNFYLQNIKLLERLFMMLPYCTPNAKNQIQKMVQFAKSDCQLKQLIIRYIVNKNPLYSKKYTNKVYGQQNRKDLSHLLSQRSLHNLDALIQQALCSMCLSDYDVQQLKDRSPKHCITNNSMFMPLLCHKIKKMFSENSNGSFCQNNAPVLQIQYISKAKFRPIIAKDFKSLKDFIQHASKFNDEEGSYLSGEVKQFIFHFFRKSIGHQQIQENIQLFLKLKYSNLTNLITSLWKQSFQQRYSLFSESFLLSIDILKIGKQSCQQSFIKSLIKDKQNLIFQNIISILNEAKNTLDFYYNGYEGTVTNFDLTLLPQELQQVREDRRLCSYLVYNVFSFLDLLVFEITQLVKTYFYNEYTHKGLFKNMSINFLDIAITSFSQIFGLIIQNNHIFAQQIDQYAQSQIVTNLYPLPGLILNLIIKVIQIYDQRNRHFDSHMYLCRSGFFDCIKKVKVVIQIVYQRTNHSENNKLGIYMLNQIIYRIVEIIRNISEQKRSETNLFLRQKIDNKDFQFIIKLLLSKLLNEKAAKNYDQFLDIYIQKRKVAINASQKIDPYLKTLVQIVIILRTLDINFRASQKFVFLHQETMALNYIDKRICVLPICYLDNQFEIYFPFHPLFEKFSQEKKNFFKSKIYQQQTRQGRLQVILKSRNMAFQSINCVADKQRILGPNFRGNLFIFLLCLSYIVVTFLLLSYKVTPKGMVLAEQDSNFLFSLGIIHLLASVTYFLNWGAHISQLSQERLNFQGYKIVRISTFGQMLKNLKYYAKNRILMIKAIFIDQPTSRPATSMLIISIFGLLVQYRIYFLSILFLFYKIDDLGSIVASFSNTWRKLTIIFVLTLVSSFIFGIFSLNKYIESLYDASTGQAQCHSIIKCINYMFIQGVIGESGSIDNQNYYQRYGSNTVYWIYFQVLIGNVVGGIIIDKFAQQRDERERIKQLRSEKCVICNVDKQTLKQKQQDYQKHFFIDHDVWNYYYFMYLIEVFKEKSDMTAIELWVLKQLQNNDVSWFPYYRKTSDDGEESDQQEETGKHKSASKEPKQLDSPTKKPFNSEIEIKNREKQIAIKIFEQISNQQKRRSNQELPELNFLQVKQAYPQSSLKHIDSSYPLQNSQNLNQLNPSLRNFRNFDDIDNKLNQIRSDLDNKTATLLFQISSMKQILELNKGSNFMQFPKLNYE